MMSAMPSSPTSRSLELLRKSGFLAQVVEKWNPHARIRQDLFGVIDVLAIDDDKTLGVQATTMSGRSSRLRKIQKSKEAVAWLRMDSRRLELWCWRKLKNRWRVHKTVLGIDETRQEIEVLSVSRGIP